MISDDGMVWHRIAKMMGIELSKAIERLGLYNIQYGLVCLSSIGIGEAKHNIYKVTKDRAFSTLSPNLRCEFTSTLLESRFSVPPLFPSTGWDN